MNESEAFTLELPPALQIALAPAQLRELELLLHATGLDASRITGRPVAGVDVHFIRLPTLVATRPTRDAA